MSDLQYEGLSTEEVACSASVHGTNRLTRRRRRNFFQQLLGNFGDPIIKVLLAVLALNIVFLFRSHDWFETIGIAIAVLLATVVSTVSEYGSETAFENLQEEASKTQCRVRRNGGTHLLPVEELVVGDLVLLQAGEPVPADGQLIKGAVTVDQSALNGESTEVKKFAGGDYGSLSASSALFRGSVVCSGEGLLRIEVIGDNTHYGKVAGELQEETRESPLKIRLADLAGKLSKIGFIAAALVAFVDVFHTVILETGGSRDAIFTFISSPSQVFGTLLHSLMLALTVVVVAVPEGLPMMITVVLSANMRRMLKDHVLVRKLVGIETSGNLNILFTDKTGTLTKGRPEVSVFLDGSGQEYDRHKVFRKTPLWELIGLSAFYNSDCQVSGGEILGGNATDKALLAHAHGRIPINTSCTVVKKIPFSSEQKWSAVTLSGDFFHPVGFEKQTITFVKGAPDKLLQHCTCYLQANGIVCPLDHAVTIFNAKKELESRAMRVIALAIATEGSDQLILLGLAGLRDELRSDVRSAIAQVQNAGVQVVMMTGDSCETATAIAYSAGLLNDVAVSDSVLTSDQLIRMNDEEVIRRLPTLRVIARAVPSDKSRLVRLAQQCGMVVGMTGDGINDAPALKKADVGFAMGSGTEVAKQAGDIVILNNRFSSVVKAILYGRTIFKSIRKFIIFQLTMNLCAVGISVLGPLLGIDTPVTVIQMLWINIIMDTLAGLAFAGEPALAEYMNEPPKRRNEPILNRYMLSQILYTGGLTVLLGVLFLKLDTVKQWIHCNDDSLYLMTAFFVLFIFCGIFNSFNARTIRLNPVSHLGKNPSFVAIMLVVVTVQIALVYYGGTLFRTTPLSLSDLLKTIGISSLVMPLDWIRKIILRTGKHYGSI